MSARSTGNVGAVSDDMPVDEPVDDLPVDDFPTDDAPIEEPAELAESIASGLVRWELPGPTGVPAVDDAVAPLAELDELPTGEHVGYYETVHRRLQDALADLDSA